MLISNTFVSTTRTVTELIGGQLFDTTASSGMHLVMNMLVYDGFKDHFLFAVFFIFARMNFKDCKG